MMAKAKTSTFGDRYADFPVADLSNSQYWCDVVQNRAFHIANDFGIDGEDREDFQSECVFQFLRMSQAGKFNPVNHDQAHKFLWLFTKRRGLDWLRSVYLRKKCHTQNLDFVDDLAYYEMNAVDDFAIIKQLLEDDHELLAIADQIANSGYKPNQTEAASLRTALRTDLHDGPNLDFSCLDLSSHDGIHDVDSPPVQEDHRND
jgi:hypothetical protein